MKWFIDFLEFLIPRMIVGHSIEPTLAWGSGTVLLPVLRSEGRSRLELKDVWFTSTAPYSLLSMTELKNYGVTYDWRTSSLMCMDSEQIIASILSWNRIETVKLNMEEVLRLKDPNETRLAFFSIDFKVLHRRLIHPGLKRIIKAAE
jgi:hypothetical protein